jgi:hypothetical protein
LNGFQQVGAKMQAIETPAQSRMNHILSVDSCGSLQGARADRSD